jgi:GT2 family glycosyltransferase
MDVSILIVSYNTREMTLAAIQSVIDQTKQVSYEIIVVDNQSTDGSADAIAKAFPQVRLIVPEKNLWFAGGNNLAAQYATGDYLLLLNPDTLILDGAIDKVVAFARANPKAGAVGGRTFFGDMRLNANSCHGVPTPWSLTCMGLGLSSAFRRTTLFDPESLGKWARDTVREVPAITGCFYLIDRRLWDELAGFDLDFVMYGEDTDLSIRVWKSGHTCLICPDARLIHYGGQADKVRPDKMVRLFRGKAQIFYKHWPKFFRNYGLAMLSLWAATRTMATGVLQSIKPEKRVSYLAWAEIWQRRQEFDPAKPSKAVPPKPSVSGGSNGRAGGGSKVPAVTSQ